MEYYPAPLTAPLTAPQSDDFVRERIAPQFAERGFGLWAVTWAKACETNGRGPGWSILTSKTAPPPAML